jgi:YbbR domain-containing protein
VRVVRFIVHNWPLKIGAVLLAVFLYVGMVALQTTQEFTGAISIDLVKQPSTGFLISPKPPPSVTHIRYIAAADVPVTRDSFHAQADLSNIKPNESEDSLVSVQLTTSDNRIQILDYQPQQIAVQLDPIAHKTVTVVVDKGVVPSGLQPGAPVLSAQTVDVFGAASIVRRVAYADAPVHIDASGIDVSQDVDLVAHDVTDAVVGNVQFNPPSVHVTIQVGSQLRTETVAVYAPTVGIPAAGYYVASVDVTPSTVAVRGQADALAQLKGLASTVPISIAGATGDVSQKVDLSLPNGVTADNATQVVVVVHLKSPDSTRSVTVGVVPDGARPDRIYSFSTLSVTATLGGATAALNAFDTSTLVATVSVGTLEVGTSTVTISLNLPPGIKQVAISPSQIVVTVSAVPTPSPKPSATP